MALRKYIAFYLGAFALLAVSILFFFRAYNELVAYIELTNRAGTVHSHFQRLSKEINNAAIVSPDLIKESAVDRIKLFQTDSQAVTNQLNLLKNAVRDSVNKRLAAQLDREIHSELLWLLKSNITDSILQHKALIHVRSLQRIDSLISEGVDRTDFLIQYRKNELYRVFSREALAVLAFILLSGCLIIYTTVRFFRQQTRRKEKEKELAKKEEQYRHALDIMIEGVQIHDFNWKYLYVNDALVKYNNVPKAEFSGITLMEKYPGIEQSDLFRVLQDCMIQRVGRQMEIEFVFPDGRKGDFELNIQPVPEGLFILSVDLTERKKAEQSLLKVNRLFAFISAINQSIVYIKNKTELLRNACNVAVQTGQFKTAWVGLVGDDRHLEMIGFAGDKNTTDDTVKFSGYNYYTDTILSKTSIGRALSSEKPAICNQVQTDPDMEVCRLEFVRNDLKSHSVFPIKQNGVVIGVFGFNSTHENFFDKEEITLLEDAVRDISYGLDAIETERKHKEAEDLVILNEKRFRALTEKSIDIKTLTSREGKFIYCSPTLTQVFGYEKEEFLGKTAVSFFYPDDIEELIKNRTAILDKPGASFNFRSRFMHKNGTPIWCEGALTNMFHEPGINAFVANFRDITEKKIIEEEREKMSNDIIQRSKHLEQFAYIISHNLRAPVANILGMANLLKGNVSDKDREQINQFMFTAVNKLDEVVMDLNKILELRADVTRIWETVAFKDLVADIQSSIGTYMQKEKAVINTDFKNADTHLSVRSYLYSIFYNLISNSIKYKKTNVPPVIDIRTEVGDGKLRIYFKDNGIGLDLNLYGEKLFKLYNRFNQTVDGKGFGLFMVKSQVEVLGGTIQVTCEPGQGCEFVVELPLN